MPITWEAVETCATNTWNKITVVCDFQEQTYDAYINDSLVATDLSIAGHSYSILHLWSLYSDVNFDDVYVGMPVKVHWVDEPQGNISDIEYFDPIEDKSKDLELRKD